MDLINDKESEDYQNDIIKLVRDGKYEDAIDIWHDNHDVDDRFEIEDNDVINITELSVVKKANEMELFDFDESDDEDDGGDSFYS